MFPEHPIDPNDREGREAHPAGQISGGADPSAGGSPWRRLAAPAAQGAALVLTALVASSTIRFLAVNWRGVMRSPSIYSLFVERYSQALGNMILPGLAFGAAALWLYRTLRLRFFSFPSRIPAATALTSVFAGLIGYATVAPAAYDFSRRTVLWAWAICLAAYFLSTLTERLDSQARARIVYSRPTQLFLDGAGVVGSAVIAYLVRFDGWPRDFYQNQMLLVIPYLVLFYLGVNYVWGVYRFIWRFTGLKEALVIAQSVASAALFLLVARILAYPYADYRVPFGVLIIQPVLLYFYFIGVRVLRRVQYRRQSRHRHHKESGLKRILLVGAGQAGQLLVRELEQRPHFQIVGFLDDDPRKSKSVIHGVRVVGSTQDLQEAVQKNQVDEVVMCMPSAHRSALKRIVAEAEKAGVPASSVPSLSEILVGKVSISRLRPVRMEDLLGRASIEYAKDDVTLIENHCRARILVTGAAGSIGSELVRQLREFEPSELVLLDKDENGLYEIGMELSETFSAFREVIADIRDPRRMRNVFKDCQPEVVFHAAAYKHVPLMESHPCEAILNNVVGSRNVAELAAEFGARSFVLVSTDKAVNPTNVMGASKRVAEIVVQRMADRTDTTRFCCVRFGNVLGSRASVVPLFQKQIREGRNITVTHPDVQRFFMTIPEAVQLIIQAGSLGSKGEIFVLEMGDPVKIVDLARDLIELSGLTPDRDISIEFTGLRPGEKLSEELLTSYEDGVRNTRYPKIFVAQAVRSHWPGLDGQLESLERAAREDQAERIREILASMNIGYSQPDAVAAPKA